MKFDYLPETICKDEQELVIINTHESNRENLGYEENPPIIINSKKYGDSVIYDFIVPFNLRPIGKGQLLVERFENCFDLKMNADLSIPDNSLVGEILSFYPNGDNRSDKTLKKYWRRGVGSYLYNSMLERCLHHNVDLVKGVTKEIGMMNFLDKRMFDRVEDVDGFYIYYKILK